MTANTEIERSYIDNAAVKEFVLNTLVPKYFPDFDISTRTSGMLGLTSELVSHIAEDGFNAASVLYRETFPNRAEIPESIYSHAAIFQLNHLLATSGTCTFIVVLEEAEIIKNMELDKTSGIYYFYLDKDTTVYVEDVPYILDYDVKIRCVKKQGSGEDGYIFTAMYDIKNVNNTISSIDDPYIRVKRSYDGYLSLELRMHQAERVYEYTNIITNSVINLPIADIPFNGKLAGFDVLYKLPGEDEFSTQLETRLIYSQPTSNPFCYYQLYNENTLRLTFNANDLYFVPDFNSELEVILYITQGATGNFEQYDGTNIITSAAETNATYESQLLVAAKPMTGSQGGRDPMPLASLQDITVENYRTAMALTTETDLQYFFGNYKWHYDDFYIKFIKRRNDIYERIFGAYVVMKNANYIFKTNTISLEMNLSDMDHPDANTWMIEPGTLFYYENEEDTMLHYWRNPLFTEIYYNEYQTALAEGTAKYLPNYYDETDVPFYIKDRNASFAEFKARHGYKDSQSIFNFMSDDDTRQAELIESLKEMDSPAEKKFLYINPFLIRFKKNPNLLSMYMTYVNAKSILDFTRQNEDSYVQFIMYEATLSRKFEKEKKYTLSVRITPSVAIDSAAHPYIALNPDYVALETAQQEGIDVGDTLDETQKYILGDRTKVAKNDLRVIAVFYDDERAVSYVELVPQYFLEGESVIVFEADMRTNDHITSDGYLRLLSEPRWYTNTGGYYRVHDDDATLYDYIPADDAEDDDYIFDIPVNTVTAKINAGEITLYRHVNGMLGGDIIQVPVDNVICKIYTLYNRVYDPELQDLRRATSAETNNAFTSYDQTLDGYLWTNEYASKTTRLYFVKPLLNVRSHVYFYDYQLMDTEGNYKNDINDLWIEHLPFVRWDLPFDKTYDEQGNLINDNLDFFMKKFEANYTQINDIIYERLRNETIIDLKFYNTYGKSNNYYIGDDNERLDKINLSISFDIWFVSGTDTLAAVPEVKRFIKDEIESVNQFGTNQLHISNLMRRIEYNFSYVDHIRFMGINAYDTTYQSIKLRYQDLDDMTTEERRFYVPELLVIDEEDITIRDYITD